MDIAKLDRFMQARPAQEEGVRWLAPFEPPLVLEGFAFFEQNGAYRRLPLDSDAVFSRARRAALIRELDVKNALVFTRTKHGANKVAGDLVKAGISAAAIHGNKSQTARQQALADFKSGAVQVLVATDIAARGLDIEELSHVLDRKSVV